MNKYYILLSLILCATPGYAQQLTIIEQDYDRAVALAEKEGKLLFVDFYTDWCAPCKELDKWVFQNDTVAGQLADDFILLRYNAENDTTFHLSKKHHVFSYPSAVVLNRQAFVLDRKYGFPGETVAETSESVFAFTSGAIDSNRQEKILVGYANTIDASKYPQFYRDYIDRVDIKVTDTEAFKTFWTEAPDVLAEEYFSPLVYFAGEVPPSVADTVLRHKATYTKLYGRADVGVALIFLTIGKFEAAIAAKDRGEFDRAVAFAREALDKDSAKHFSQQFEAEFLQALKE